MIQIKPFEIQINPFEVQIKSFEIQINNTRRKETFNNINSIVYRVVACTIYILYIHKANMVGNYYTVFTVSICCAFVNETAKGTTSVYCRTNN